MFDTFFIFLFIVYCKYQIWLYICYMKNTQVQQIKQDLINGIQFGNDVSNWFTIVNVSQNRFIIEIDGTTKIYNNIDTVAKKINNLINKGI